MLKAEHTCRHRRPRPRGWSRVAGAPLAFAAIAAGADGLIIEVASLSRESDVRRRPVPVAGGIRRNDADSSGVRRSGWTDAPRHGRGAHGVRVKSEPERPKRGASGAAPAARRDRARRPSDSRPHRERVRLAREVGAAKAPPGCPRWTRRARRPSFGARRSCSRGEARRRRRPTDLLAYRRTLTPRAARR